MNVRKFVNLVNAILLLSLMGAGIWACQGRDRDVPPSQSDLDQVIQIIIMELERFSQQFANVQNCDDFDQVVASIPNEIPCTKGGSIATKVTQSSCTQDDPLMATVTLATVAQNCTLEGKASSGMLEIVLAFDGMMEMGTLAAQDLVILAIKLNFSGVEVILENSMATMCSGMMTVFESIPCTMDADCSGCQL